MKKLRTIQDGQAMMELLLGLVLVVLLMVGIMTVGEMGFEWVSAMTEATGNAQVKAVADNSSALGSDQQVIWKVEASPTGTDLQMQRDYGLSYEYTTRDKKFTRDEAQLYQETKDSLKVSSNGVAIDYPSANGGYVKENFSAAMENSSVTTGWLGAVGGGRYYFNPKDSMDRRHNRYDLGNAFSNLVYGGQKYLDIATEAYFPALSKLNPAMP